MKKTVIIFGAGVVGIATAKALDTMNKVFIDTDEEALRSAANEVSGSFSVKASGLDEANIIQAVEKAADAAGGVDALLNCRLIMKKRAARDISGDDMSTSFDKCPRAYFLMAKACAPYMVKNGGGRIVNLSSVHSKVADSMHTEFAMESAAIAALTRELAANYWADNIQVVTVTACFIDGQFPDELDNCQRQTPESISLLGRRVTANDVAKTIKFALTAKTKCFNGNEIRADAGYITTQYKIGDAPFVVKASKSSELNKT